MNINRKAAYLLTSAAMALGLGACDAQPTHPTTVVIDPAEVGCIPTEVNVQLKSPQLGPKSMYPQIMIDIDRHLLTPALKRKCKPGEIPNPDVSTPGNSYTCLSDKKVQISVRSGDEVSFDGMKIKFNGSGLTLSSLPMGLRGKNADADFSIVRSPDRIKATYYNTDHDATWGFDEEGQPFVELDSDCKFDEIVKVKAPKK